MVTFSRGRLPAGPNTGKTQTAAQAREDFTSDCAQAPGSGLQVRAAPQERGQRAHSKLSTELHWVRCTAGARVRCTARGWTGASRLVLGAADLAA